MVEQVDVLLATYQGAQYLEELLESILTQTHPHLHLWVRDDGSTDQTLLILQKWIEAYPHKITLLTDEKHLGIKGNFSELMRQSQAPYLMLADQDDKWLPHKVEASLDQLKAMERQYGSHLPLLVHTDLKVVSQDLKVIASSFWRYAGLNPEHTSLNRLLAQNVLTGCTLLMNRALIDLALPIPQKAMMHDWWLALIAACFGHIQHVNQATLLYRQHAGNDTGAKRYDLWYFLKRFARPRQKRIVVSKQTYQQAHCLLEQYHAQLSPSQRHLIQAYIELEHLSYFKQKKQIIRNHFFKHGFLRNARIFLTKV